MDFLNTKLLTEEVQMAKEKYPVLQEIIDKVPYG
jgi:hypothetical protein